MGDGFIVIFVIFGFLVGGKGGEGGFLDGWMDG